MNLSQLIDTHRGARSYADLSRDCGDSPTSKRLQQMVRSSLKNFPDPPTIRALSRGLKVPQVEVVLAAAESLGLDVRRNRPRLVELLPDSVERLSEPQAAAVAHLIAVFAEDMADADPQEDQLASERIEPTVAAVLAARRRREEEAAKVIDATFPGFMLDVAFDAPNLTNAYISKAPSNQSLFMQALGRLSRSPQKWDEALAGISELYVTDVIDHDQLVEAIDEAREIVLASASPLAARRGIPARSITDRAQDEAEQGNQDTGEMEPS